jgi:hypothetical protein
VVTNIDFVTRHPCTLSSAKNKKKLQKEKILMLWDIKE